MNAAPLPPNEVERLEALRRYNILYTPPEESFDRITALAARLFKVPIALVSFVDEFRVWLKSWYGFDKREYPREVTICSFAVLGEDVLVIPDTREDPRFACMPFAVSEPAIRFYAGAPLLDRDGFNLGTLCILDYKPRYSLSPEERTTLVDLAAVVVEQLELRVAYCQLQHLEAERTQLLKGEQQARALAQVQRSYLESLLMQAPASISITKGTKGSELVYEFANPAYYQLVGKHELIGKSIGELFPELEDQVIYEILDGVIATGKPFVGKEFPIKLDRRGDGTIEQGFFNFVYQPVYGVDGNIEGVMSFAFEVTDQVLSRQQIELLAQDLLVKQTALRESEERYRALVIATSQAVWTTNAQGFIVEDLPAWRSMTGQSEEEIKGWGWLNAVHPEDREKTAQGWISAIETKSIYEIEHRVQTADGNYHYFSARGVPVFTEDGSVREWVGAHTDITLAKLLEQERAQFLVKEQAARERAESANRVKDEFLAVLSHELRSPLNPILGWIKLLRTRQFDKATADRALATIERNAQLQTRLIEDLLDISRIMQGKLTLKVALVDLKSTISAAIETVSLAAEAKSIQIYSFLSASVGLVSGDASRLQQVVWNLLGNAIKFTPTGGRVEVELSEVENSDVLTTTSYAQIQVSDTGQGISAEFMPHVFEYFRQADGSINRKHGGLGLGLAIARNLVEMHGGTIYAESEGEGKGATFTVRLPLIKAQPQTSEPSQLLENPLQLNGVRILVVDDEPDTLELHAFMLEQYGAEAIKAASVAEALQLLEELNPDLLISDLGMPEQDGYALIRQVRANEVQQGRHIPAIAVTAYAREEDRHKALAAGFDVHISKPVEPLKLLEAIASISLQLANRIVS